VSSEAWRCWATAQAFERVVCSGGNLRSRFSWIGRWRCTTLFSLTGASFLELMPAGGALRWSGLHLPHRWCESRRRDATVSQFYTRRDRLVQGRGAD
jgi:hypothetical protein